MKYLILSVCLCFLASNVFAHSGRTNSDGCHNNTKTDNYHCH